MCVGGGGGVERTIDRYTIESRQRQRIRQSNQYMDKLEEREREREREKVCVCVWRGGTQRVIDI